MMEKKRLRYRYEEEFMYDEYMVTEIMDRCENGSTPEVGKTYRGVINEGNGLTVIDNKYRGNYYAVKSELIKEKEDYKEYLKNVNPDELYEYDLMAYNKYLEEYGLKTTKSDNEVNTSYDEIEKDNIISWKDKTGVYMVIINDDGKEATVSYASEKYGDSWHKHIELKKKMNNNI